MKIINDEELSLKHKEQLASSLKDVNTELSEYSFSNLYLFRKAHSYRFLTTEINSYITGITYDGKKYLMPTNDLLKLDDKQLEELYHLMQSHEMIFPIPEAWLHLFPNEFYKQECVSGDSDYIFLTEKIATYSGKKLHNKKNLMNQFQNNYLIDIKEITSENINEALFILDQWQKQSELPNNDTDYNSCLEAINLISELNLCGRVFYADNKPAGFILGEALNQRIYAIHFAKGLTIYKGIYQYMFSKCAEFLADRYYYFNMEQDMGNPFLRQSKSSYHPDWLTCKYRISLK